MANKPRVVSKDTWKPTYTKILLLTQSQTPVENICTKVGLAARTVRWVRSSPYFQKKLSEMNEKVLDKAAERTAYRLSTDKAREVFLKNAYAAARIVVHIAKKGVSKDRIKLDAAKDVLDRAGLKPMEIVETHERVYTPEEVNSALITIREIEGVMQRLSKDDNRFLLRNTLGDVVGSPETDDGSEPSCSDRQNQLST